MTRTLLDLEISPATLAGWGACWSPRQIAEYLAAIGTETTTLGAALEDGRITPVHRVWLGCEALARHDRPRLTAFARGCADAAARAADWAWAAAYWARAAAAWAAVASRAAGASRAAYAAYGAAAEAAEAAYGAENAARAAARAAGAERGRQLAHLVALAGEVAS